MTEWSLNFSGTMSDGSDIHSFCCRRWAIISRGAWKLWISVPQTVMYSKIKNQWTVINIKYNNIIINCYVIVNMVGIVFLNNECPEWCSDWSELSDPREKVRIDNFLQVLQAVDRPCKGGSRILLGEALTIQKGCQSIRFYQNVPKNCMKFLKNRFFAFRAQKQKVYENSSLSLLAFTINCVFLINE